jgi:uncharacterized membrane protein YqhA
MTTQELPIEPRDHTPLWVVFWIYGVLISHLIFGAILYFYRQLESPILAALLIGFLAYTAWIMRAVWVNAFNVQREIHGHIARALTVAWAINAVLMSLFLFLGHLGAVTLPI